MRQREFSFGTDENGQITCPIPGCGAPLNVDRSMRIPLVVFDGGEDNHAAPVDAVADGWEVTCDECHTIDRNTQESDWRESFSLRWLLETGKGQPPTCAWCGEPFGFDESRKAEGLNLSPDGREGRWFHEGECWRNRHGGGER